MHIKKSLLTTDISVVSLLRLFLKVDEFGHLLGGWERDGVNSLQRIVVCFAEPIGRRILHDLKSLDELCARNVRSRAQINQITALVSSDFGAVGDFTNDGLYFKWILFEEFESFVFGQNQTLEGLVFFYDLLSCVLNCFVILV